MEQYTIQFIIAGVILFFGIVSPFASHFFRLFRILRNMDSLDSTQEDDESHELNGLSPVSIVMMALDNASHLEDNLPRFLNQVYPEKFEVIVVCNESDKDIEETISHLKAQFSNLRFTFIPNTTRYLSRRKLGMTLGFKSATYEWVIVTDTICEPENDNWLTSFAQNLKDDKQVVLGYTHYDEDAKDRFHFDHIADLAYDLTTSQRNGAITTSSPLVAVRKELFLSNHGFTGNLEYVGGEYGYLVNKLSTKENTSFALNSASWLKESTMKSTRWHEEKLYQVHMMKHLPSAGWHKFYQYLDSDILKITILATLAGLSYGAWGTYKLVESSPAPFNLMAIDFTKIDLAPAIILVASIIALLFNCITRAIIINKVRKMMNCDIGIIKNMMLENTRFIRDLSRRIRLRFTSKYDFITHKI